MIDFVTLCLYFFIVVLLGWKYAGKSTSNQSYFLGNRQIGWVPLLLSLVATETSSLTFLSIPALSYQGKFGILLLAFGYILGRITVSLYLLPLYYSQGTVSIYSWVGERFGSFAQKSLSFVFATTRVLGDGVRLYVTSIPFAILLQVVLPYQMTEEQSGILSLFVLSAITILYSAYGGFKAIVFTDALQFVVYILGGFFSLFLLGKLLGFSEVLPTLSQREFQFYTLPEKGWGDLFTTPYFPLFSVLGGFFLSMGSHGTDQMLVQRILACKSLSEGRKALIWSGIVVWFQFALFLMIGALLAMFYSKSSLPADKIFSHFIINEVPTPFLGLILSAILASAMSTLSSTINSLTLTSVMDWKIWKETKYLHQKSSVFWGFILFLSSLLPFFLSSGFQKTIIEVGLSIASYTWGSNLSLFFLAWKSKNEKIPKILFGCSYFGSIVGLLALTHFYPLAFTLLIPTGILIFGSIYVLGKKITSFLGL